MSDILAQTYDGAKAVTKSDTDNDPDGPFAGLLVTATGTVSLVTIRGDTISLTAVAANTVLPFATKRVNTTGTAATVLGLLAPRFEGARNT
jgi:hypothetical protein